MAHELTHGFDDQGKKRDKFKGNRSQQFSEMYIGQIPQGGLTSEIDFFKA